jgi:hypothetical protein
LAPLGVAQRPITEGDAAAPDLPGAEVAAVEGYADIDAMRAALVDVETMLLVPIREHPEHARLRV